MTTEDSSPAQGNGWLLHRDGWDREAVTHHGNLFLLGNGRMGCRGTLEEFGPDERVGIMLAGLYDRYGDAWREPVNAPNPFFTEVSLNRQVLHPGMLEPESHFQELDLRAAVHRRQTLFSTDGIVAKIFSERFLSAENVHLMGMAYTVTVDGPCELTLSSGIDQRIWDLNGPHLKGFHTSIADDVLVLSARTVEKDEQVSVVEHSSCETDAEILDSSVSGSIRFWTLRFSRAGTVRLVKLAAVGTGIDFPTEEVETASRKMLEQARRTGYRAIQTAHVKVWEDRWQRAEVMVKGDPEGVFALRYSIYQLLSAAPFHSEHLSIPARALSGQVYKGAIFWDTEIFMFPFFLACFPEVARNLVRYRINTLEGAREKAREYGYKGAFFPWEGQEGGLDACTLFNITDVFTQRPMRTYFRDKQIHISADVAWSVFQYYKATGDVDILWEGGWELLLECARFFHSRAYRKSDDSAFVLTDVTGPDEYHERVDNNAYTNHMVHFTLQALLSASRDLGKINHNRFSRLRKGLASDPAELSRLEDFSRRLYLPMPDPDTFLVEQFDGYIHLENCGLAALRERILDPNEYLGGGNGLATTTQILKQADVVLLLHLLRERFTKKEMLANWDYYEPRTEHGSSLSACAYALVAAYLGRLDFAYSYFLKTATVDLEGKSKQFVGTLYIGGTHPAANGGAWLVAVQGFGGMLLHEHGLHFDPHLPDHWNVLAFPVTWRGQSAKVTIDKEEIRLIADPRNSADIAWSCGDTHTATAPGKSTAIRLHPGTKPAL